MRNGKLLNLMVAEHFEALFTSDRNLPFQQNLRASGIAVVIAVARTNRVKKLRSVMPKVLHALRIVKAGEAVSVSNSRHLSRT